jgi:hypothetical protein
MILIQAYFLCRKASDHTVLKLLYFLTLFDFRVSRREVFSGELWREHLERRVSSLGNGEWCIQPDPETKDTWR